MYQEDISIKSSTSLLEKKTINEYATFGLHPYGENDPKFATNKHLKMLMNPVFCNKKVHST